MITINRGATNSCVFTLNESTTIPNASYIIKFHSNQNFEDKIMWLNNDLTDSPVRYNYYIITESDSEDLNNNTISLSPATYDYTVYETISATLSLDYADGIVEQGLVKVNGTYSNIQKFSDEDSIGVYLDNDF